MRKGYCITSEESEDNFVGVRFHNGDPEVVFPHGYNISDDEKEQRKDVFRLLAVLKRFSDRSDGSTHNKGNDISELPLSSYQYIIQDFLTHGYYSEKEIKYVESARGKINWKRTVQQEQPHIDGNNVVYLKFQTKTNRINTDNLITHIHECCVYKSFLKFGWLYFSSDYLPPKPPIKPDVKLFVSVLSEELNKTFNDEKKKLFQNMINVILNDNGRIDNLDAKIGVTRFEYVWERMIDYIFGESDKERYFPHATWHIIKNNKIEQSSALEPDTIMKFGKKIYVLDAKYYKYGITEWTRDLPQTSSIQKQITYGKHISGMDQVESNDVYNAFIMPFQSKTENPYQFVSVGTADWESYSLDSMNYAYVLGILADTKHLISTYTRHNESAIEQLSDLIEESLEKYKQMAYL